MYLIQDIMTEIWKPISKSYKEAYEKASRLEAEEIFQQLKHIEMSIVEYPAPYPKMNLLATTGCYHAIKDGNHSGCSMCNDSISRMSDAFATVNALRHKDVNLYAKFVRSSFENKRGIVGEQMGTEVVTGCDCLSDMEFPEEVYKELFGKNGVFQVRPFRYSFEIRADSITKEKLDMMLGYLGKGRTYIEIGVEVVNQWIRNNWINKNVTDVQIEAAINLIQEAGCKVNANVLIGVPGLTEEQSIDLFLESIERLLQLNVNRITFHPLNRKAYTLHNFIYEKLRDNQRLAEIGIAHGEHTGLPWMFTIIEAMARAFEMAPHLKKSFGVGQFNIFRGSDVLVYNNDRECQCNSQLFETIDRTMKSLDITELMEIRETMKKDKCYEEYIKLIEKQKKAGDIRNTVGIVGEEIIKALWPNCWEKKLDIFKTELMDL
ncbi:radical SAM protein [Alkaliphilus peptidifermentans]|uniref:Elp3/MiaA/NifB-like radical SAM core domain-containing protein n=1 Tax=Alkaliphilus peptidifermentans DSM 18978 TaxID=1120976 RepID=A0A1G5I4M6_9FIRM|nr:radical SAM protein [Alkaliphilus peptidifermentans]SCY70963.1 hypothetical protein SAMN03080606_02255 [Alkaliphilus peptidifermentans DSM 18978]